MLINWLNIYSKILCALFVCTLGLWFFANYSGHSSGMLFFVIVYIGFIVMSGLLSLASSTHFSIQTRKWNFGTFLISLGLISWGIAEFMWFYYENFLYIEMPYPSMADVMYMGFYPFIICGLIPFIMDVRDRVFSKSKLSVITVFLLLTIITGVYFVLARFGVDGLPSDTLKAIFDTSYIVWDAVLLVVLVILIGYVLISAQNYKKYVNALVAICAGSLLMLLADVLFSYLSGTGTYTQGNYIDLIYLVSAFLIGLATIKFSETSVQSPSLPIS